MRNEIENVLEAMREDYKRWSNWSSNYKPNAHSDTKRPPFGGLDCFQFLKIV